MIEEYGRYGVEIIREEEQDSTDFSKALKLILKRVEEGHLDPDQFRVNNFAVFEFLVFGLTSKMLRTLAEHIVYIIQTI